MADDAVQWADGVIGQFFDSLTKGVHAYTVAGRGFELSDADITEIDALTAELHAYVIDQHDDPSEMPRPTVFAAAVRWAAMKCDQHDEERGT